MTAVEFGDGRTPHVVYRRPKVKRYVHALVRDTKALPASWRDELASWLEDRGVEDLPPSVLVSRAEDGGGFRVHALGTRLEIERGDLPVWLQSETPEPPAQPKVAKRAAVKRTRYPTVER